MDFINNQCNRLSRFSEKEVFKYILLFSILGLSSGIRYIEEYKFLGIIKDIFMLVTPIILLIIIINKKQLNRCKRGVNLLFILTAVFALVSSIWSQESMVTFKNGILLGSTTIIAIYMALNFTKEEIFEMLLLWFIAIVAINLVLIVFKIGNIYDVQEVRYKSVVKGIFKHRNLLGFYMTLAMGLNLWFVLYKCEGEAMKNVCTATIIVSIIILYMSKSMTSMILAVGMFILVFITKFKKVRKIIIYGIIPALILVIYMIIYQPQWYVDLLALIGRTPDLTDRDVIWRGVIAGIQTKPLLGYGYTGYWTNNIYSVNFVAKFYGGFPNHAHNGYLEILLDFGVIGATIIAANFSIIMNKIKKMGDVAKGNDLVYVNFILAFVTFMLCYNLIESPLVRHMSTIYILFILFFNIVEGIYSRSKIKEDN
ncbi:MAG: O-antigen ligase family protein [Clostridium sp.]|uniref:O-antigen ligase family protein n=1 Tax=Clostridium sp. TaxID=1506 RepID=UPI00303C0143